MTATLPRRPPTAPARTGQPPSGRRVVVSTRELVALLAVLALLVTASMPLARVYIGLAFLKPVLAAVVLSVGLSWGARRLGAGPVTALLVSIAGWLVFCSTAFLATTLVGGVVPGPETLRAGVDLWAYGMQLVLLRPAPAFAEPGLLLLTVTGVWAIAHAVEGLVFRLGAPLRAIAMALVLWTVPLALAPPATTVWHWAVPLLAAGAVLLLTFVGSDVEGWKGYDGGHRAALYPTGAVVAGVAIVAGVVLASSLPGYGDAALRQLRGIGGTTLTTNPIVDIRSRLVAEDTGPVLHVSTSRPVYLRVTSLDHYSENEEWTNAGIHGSPITPNDDLLIATPTDAVEPLKMHITVQNLSGAVLVPAPYRIRSVYGPASDRFQYDEANATLTLDPGAKLEPGDTYSVEASIPSPGADDLRRHGYDATDGRYTELPANVPASVRELAQDIVERTGAETPFDIALELQKELRTWTYTTDLPQGHSGRAMEQFLEDKAGYCEQFAGTMAVMLRTLGIPSRVAVGYSPGQPIGTTIDPDLYEITNANAHAWVEVLFPRYGWIAFEPTPRGDGNVLVPTAMNLAPEELEISQRGSSSPAEGTNIFDERGDSRFTQSSLTPAGEAPAPVGVGGAPRSTLGVWLAGAAIVAVVAGVMTVLLLRRRRRAGEASGTVPRERVIAARHRVEVVATGLGITAASSETDAEYLARVSAKAGAAGTAAANDLASCTAAARYALRLPTVEAERADAAAAQLTTSLLAGLGRWRRTVVWVRGPLTLLRRRASEAVPGWLRVGRGRETVDGGGARPRRAYESSRRRVRSA